MEQPHHDDEAGDGHAQPPGPFPADSRAGQPVLDVERDGRERREHVQPVADLADPRVADLEAAEPHQDQPRDEDHERDAQKCQSEPDRRPVRPLPRGRQVNEAEDQERHDQEKAQEQVQGNHQHIEERLLGRAAPPGERGHAREVEAVGAQECEADQDDPEKRAQPRADGRRVDPAAAVAHGSSLNSHDRWLPRARECAGCEAGAIDGIDE